MHIRISFQLDRIKIYEKERKSDELGSLKSAFLLIKMRQGALILHMTFNIEKHIYTQIISPIN